MSKIVEYSETEAGLAKLKESYADAEYAVDTTQGMVEAKGARRELVLLRTDLERKRKEIKAPALEHCKQIDAEAKRITEEIKTLEDPIDAQIKKAEEAKAEEKRKKDEAERVRIAVIQETIAVQIGEMPMRMMHSPASEIKEAMEMLERTEMEDEVFEEYIGDAVQAKAIAVRKLSSLHQQALEREIAESKRLVEEKKRREEQEAEDKRLKEEADRLEKQRLKEEQERFIKDKIFAITATPTAVIGGTSKEIKEKHSLLLQDEIINGNTYPGFETEANTALSTALTQLEKMFKDTRDLEDKQDYLAEEQRKIDDINAKEAEAQQQADEEKAEQIDALLETDPPAFNVGAYTELLDVHDFVKNMDMKKRKVDIQKEILDHIKTRMELYAEVAHV